MEASAQAAQLRAYDGLKVYTTPQPGTVSVVFHTYFGFIIHTIQTEHRFYASPDDALLALWRLHKFNLTWGMFAYPYYLVIPLLSYGNYLAQRRSIGRQAAAGGRGSVGEKGQVGEKGHSEY